MVEVNNRLCHACDAIFSGSTGPHRSTEQARFPVRHTHHLNLQSFRTAVDVGCFICSIFYESRGAQSTEIRSEEQEPFSTYVLRERDQINRTCMLNVQINNLHAASANIKPPYYGFEIVKVGGDIALNIPSNQRLNLLRRWISDCCQSDNAPHAACQHYRETARKLKPRKPSRLLELGAGDSQGSVRLMLLGPAATPFPPYVTLGGRGKAPDGMSSLLTAMHNNWLPVNQLPRTIQDALTITKYIGARFLWTPDLCDDNVSTRDQHHHSNRGDIIAGGLFHIARAAHDVAAEDEGILPAGGQNPSVPVVVPTWAAQGSKFAVLDPDTMGKALAAATSDAQAYHDNFIAPATLYCTKQQLWWQCLEGSYSETFPSGVGNGSKLPWIRGIHNLDPCVFHNLDDSLPMAFPTWPFVERLTSLWTQVVSVFSAAANRADDDGCRGGDRLLLMDSMAAHFRDLASPYQPGFETAVYRAGMWFFAAGCGVHQLLWHTPNFPGGNREAAPGRRVSAVPTWSWAATTAPVQYSFYLPKMGFSLTPAIWPGTILDDAVAEVVSMARSAEAGLTMRGRLIPIEIMQDERSRPSGSFCAVFLDAGRATGRVLFDTVEEEELAKEHGGKLRGYFALPLTFMTLDSPGPSRPFGTQGLVLRPRSAGGGHDCGNGVYARCGWFHCDSTRDFQDKWKHVDVMQTFGLGKATDRQTILLV